MIKFFQLEAMVATRTKQAVASLTCFFGEDDHLKSATCVRVNVRVCARANRLPTALDNHLWIYTDYTAA